MRLGAYLKQQHMQDEQRAKQEAQQRLLHRFETAPQMFGIDVPTPLKQDLADYRTAYGSGWPLRQMNDQELQNRQEYFADDPSKNVANMPTEITEQWQSAHERAKQQQANELDLLQDRYNTIGQVLGGSVDSQDIGRSIYGLPEAKEQWNDPYQGPGGSMLQRSNRGKVSSVLGREPIGPEMFGPLEEGPDGSRIQRGSRGTVRSVLGRKPDSAGLEDKRADKRRSYIMRLMGVNDMSSYDPETSHKILEINNLADQYLSQYPGISENQAMNQAYNDISQRYSTAQDIPGPKTSFFGDNLKNKEDGVQTVMEMRQAGFDDYAIQRHLIDNGWNMQQIGEVMQSAPAPYTPPPQPQAPAQQPAAGQQNATQQITPEIKQRYFELRNQGYTKEQAIAEITGQ